MQDKVAKWKEQIDLYLEGKTSGECAKELGISQHAFLNKISQLRGYGADIPHKQKIRKSTNTQLIDLYKKK